MENVRTTPVSKTSSGQITTEDAVISVDDIVQRMLNDIGNRQERLGKTKDLAGHEDQSAEISTSGIFMNMQLVVPQNVLAALPVQNQDKGRDIANKRVSVPQQYGHAPALPTTQDLITQLQKTTLPLDTNVTTTALHAEAQPKHESAREHTLSNIPVPATLQPQNTADVIHTSASDKQPLRSSDKGMTHPAQFLSTVSAAEELQAKQEVTEIRWTFPTQQSARVRIEHAQNRADTQVQVVPSDTEIGQRLANFQQQHPIQALRVEVASAQNDYLHSQQNSQQQQQNQAERDTSSEEDEV